MDPVLDWGLCWSRERGNQSCLVILEMVREGERGWSSGDILPDVVRRMEVDEVAGLQLSGLWVTNG